MWETEICRCGSLLGVADFGEVVDMSQKTKRCVACPAVNGRDIPVADKKSECKPPCRKKALRW